MGEKSRIGEMRLAIRGFSADVVVAAAALAATRSGAEVALPTKLLDPSETNTRYAQGGIIYTAPDDSPDLLAAGDGNSLRRNASQMKSSPNPASPGDVPSGCATRYDVLRSNLKLDA